jgi:hypothetical protein
MNVSTAFASTQNVSTSFLYYNNYVIAGTRIGYSNVLNKNSFSPLYINGLSLWMDAADTSVVRLSGANVVSIADKSASGLTMTATGTVPYVTAAQNGLNAVGNLTNTAYLATSSNNFDFYFNNFAVFAVVRTEPTVGALYPVVSKNFGFGTGAPSSNYWSLYGGNANPPPFNMAVIPANASFNVVISPTTTISTWIVISSAIYRATNSSVVAINGTPSNVQNTNAGPLNAGPLPIIIGASLLGSSPLSFSSLVGEVLIYNASITTFQRQQVEGYLAWKWGLQANLPASHPFFSAPPT